MTSKRIIMILVLFMCFCCAFADSSPDMSFVMVHRIIKDEDLCSGLFLDYEQYAAAVSSGSGLPDSSIPGMTVSSVDVSNAQGLKFAVLFLKTFGSVDVSSLTLDFTALTNPPQATNESVVDVVPFSMKIYRVSNLTNAIYTTPAGNETGAANGVSVISTVEPFGEVSTWRYDPVAVLEITVNDDDAIAGTYGGTRRCYVSFNN